MEKGSDCLERNWKLALFVSWRGYFLFFLKTFCLFGLDDWKGSSFFLDFCLLVLFFFKFGLSFGPFFVGGLMILPSFFFA